jgi:predicted MPP superfamily phosphohydrolase
MKKGVSIRELLASEPRLIRLPSKGKAVFIGDTHGDFDATEIIFRRYFRPGYTLVFLGDYVDRGEESRKNIEFLLEKKVEAPKQIYLLAGNHEGYCSVPFHPADFWEELSAEDLKVFSLICGNLPFAAVTENGIIAAHGAVPDINSPENINDIQTGNDEWHQLTWGDFQDEPGELIGHNSGRPLFGKDYFRRTMKQLGANVLIRSHQHSIQPVIFDRQCLTLMTSYAYDFTRSIAIADLEKPVINSTDDLIIEEI